MFRIGIGYDVHRLVNGRRLFLGGVRIPYAKGLDGHSDADVLLHAICDSLLGAAGLDDIGHYFPPTDNRYKNISSLKLLAHVAQLIKKSGYAVVNVDTTVIAEEPKIGPYRNAIKTVIAAALRIKPHAIGIKATTNEGLGFLGQKKGIAAYAVSLLEGKKP